MFGPVKYFKSISLVNKDFIKGFAFNRKHFHATKSVISCILWGNTDSNNEEWDLEAYDIINGEINQLDDLHVRKIHKGISMYNDRRTFDADVQSNLVCYPSGKPKTDWNPTKKKAMYNDNIIAFMVTIGNSIDAKHRGLTRLPYYVGIEQSFGYYLRSDNYIEKLPIFCAKLYPQDEWYETDVYFNSADKGYEYTKDKDLLRSCLIYTCLSYDNKCRSIIIDDKIYQNELCLDGESIAAKDLHNLTLTDTDKEIIKIYETILDNAKKTEEYNMNIRYGLWQIDTDINKSWEDENGNRIYKYPELNGYIRAL